MRMEPKEVSDLFDLAGMVELGTVDEHELGEHVVANEKPGEIAEQQRISLVPHSKEEHITIILHGKRHEAGFPNKPATSLCLTKGMAKRVAQSLLMMLADSEKTA